jgi:hypothetical protein
MIYSFGVRFPIKGYGSWSDRGVRKDESFIEEVEVNKIRREQI